METKKALLRNSGKGGRADLDLPLKLQTAAALAANGYFCRINVNLSATNDKGLSDVTDVDVLGVRYDVAFTPTSMAVSAKSGEARSLSPAREIFYLRGVLEYLEATSGVLLLSRRTVAGHLKDLGRQLRILVLSEQEVDEWASGLTKGIDAPGYFDQQLYSKYVDAISQESAESLGRYLQTEYWFFRDFRNLQNVLAHYKKIAPNINGQKPWHATLSLNTAAHLCLTVFDLCRTLRFLGLNAVEEKTATYLFGGVTSFKARRDLYTKVEQLLSSTGTLVPGGPGLPPLEPAYTAALAELAVRFVQRPSSAIRIPVVLQDALWRSLGAKGATVDESTTHLAAEKLAQDLLDFIKAASGAPWTPKI